MYKLKFCFSIFILLLLFSCSTNRVSISNLSKINGTYHANTIGNTNINSNQYNFVSLLNRKLITDTLKNRFIYNYKFKLEVLDKKHIEITVIDGTNDILSKKKYKYTVKREYLILKNKNTRPLLIPYLIGALDVTKLKVKYGDEKNLNVLINQHRSGGVLMIPMGWSNSEANEQYKRIE